MTPSSESVLFVTLDSCRFDTFERSHCPAMRQVGPLYKAQAPSHFTYGSHSAMFVGFTPGVPGLRRAIIDTKFAKMFKLVAGGAGGQEGYLLNGPNIIKAFEAIGFATIGSGAVNWFNPSVPTGLHLSQPFQQFHYSQNTWSARSQIEWMLERIDSAKASNVFAFLNVGETHVPYWHEGADWDANDNPCQPYQQVDRRADCEYRQRRCCEFLDSILAPLIGRFLGSTILLCADHGDCWGEDGLWAHGISHPMTLTVPLLARLRGKPV